MKTNVAKNGPLLKALISLSVALLTLSSVCLTGCADKKTLNVNNVGGNDEKPDSNGQGSQKLGDPLHAWRFFCVEGQTESNVLTFRGLIQPGVHPKTLMIRDEKEMPITEIRHLLPLSFADQQGEFIFSGRKLEMDRIRLTPEKTALQLVKIDFFKGESRWIRSYPFYEIPKSMDHAMPWAEKRFSPYGWDPDSKQLLVPTEKGSWAFSSWVNFKEIPVNDWKLDEYYNPVFWNQQWLLWHWEASKQSGQLELWNSSHHGEVSLIKTLWTKGRLLDLKAGREFVTALFNEGSKVHWLVINSDLKIVLHKELEMGGWVLGLDNATDVERPWVANGNGGAVKVYEWNGEAIDEISLIVPLIQVEIGSQLTQMVRYGSSTLLQFVKGESRFWKRQSGLNWSALDRLDCQGLTSLKVQENL